MVYFFGLSRWQGRWVVEVVCFFLQICMVLVHYSRSILSDSRYHASNPVKGEALSRMVSGRSIKPSIHLRFLHTISTFQQGKDISSKQNGCFQK